MVERNTNLGIVYFIHDISQQKELIQALHDIASYDSLTEIFNRGKLMEELEKELLRMKRYGKCFSVLMVDIDHFKLVNDLYGHQAGDEVLKALATECKNRIRKTDSIGRYGGEEFMIILPESDEDSAFHVAESIRKSIADLDFRSNEDLIKITISIGIKTVYHNEDSLSVEYIIKCADSALYNAKRNGRNQTSASADATE